MQSEQAAGPVTREGDGEQEEPGLPPQAGLALELLVHGVGGATPQEMLGDPRTERVTGDETAAVYRRTEDVDAEEHPADYADRPVPEAYCWSNLTSGNSTRALWLILLPFMVANLAHWMCPVNHGRRTAVRLHGALVRLLALTLTVLLVAAACEVALDLAAWQCAGSPACAAEHSWLGFLSADAGGHGGWWSQPGRRLALAAAVPTALTALLWWLSHRTWSAYESQLPLERPHQDRPTADGYPPSLSQPGFWYGRRMVARLRAAHTAAGLLTVAAAVVLATGRFDRRPGGSTALDTLGWLLGALVAGGGVWVVHTVCSRGRKERATDHRTDRITVRALPGASVVLLVLTVVHAAWSRPGWSADGRLPGNETFGVLAVTQGLLVAAMAVIGLLLHRSTRVPRTVLAGLGSASVAMLACALGGVMSGGVAQRVADWLDGSGTPGMGNGLIHGPPTILTWQASIIPVLLVVLAVLLCWFVVRLSRRKKRLAAHVHEDYPDEEYDASRSRRIAGALARAALTDSAPWLVGAIALITLLLGLVAVLGTWFTGEVPGEVADGAPAVLDGFADTVQALGSWLVGFGFLLFVTWGRRAYRDASARRTIGILWDVGTFWPRAAHPFAPPCYAERAVPDLAWRMAAWTEAEPDRRLVISGHSQGSVLAAAAVWQLDPVTRSRVALLTYGCPLERLYGRWFPAYFGPAPLDALHGEVDRWRNLWRLTDPIGGPVRLPDEEQSEVDRGPLRDPLNYGRTLEKPLPSPILAHGEYQADPAFDEERDGLLARLLGGRADAAGAAGAPPGAGTAAGRPPGALGGLPAQPAPKSP